MGNRLTLQLGLDFLKTLTKQKGKPQCLHQTRQGPPPRASLRSKVRPPAGFEASGLCQPNPPPPGLPRRKATIGP